jgi:hypothetical protein
MGLDTEWQGKFLGEFFLNFTVVPVFSRFDLARCSQKKIRINDPRPRTTKAT